jgi:hypothetical protein
MIHTMRFTDSRPRLYWKQCRTSVHVGYSLLEAFDGPPSHDYDFLLWMLLCKGYKKNHGCCAIIDRKVVPSFAHACSLFRLSKQQTAWTPASDHILSMLAVRQTFLSDDATRFKLSRQ